MILPAFNDPVLMAPAVLGPDRHRHEGTQLDVRHVLAAVEQQMAQTAGNDAQHDVVDRAADPGLVTGIDSVR